MLAIYGIDVEPMMQSIILAIKMYSSTFLIDYNNITLVPCIKARLSIYAEIFNNHCIHQLAYASHVF